MLIGYARVSTTGQNLESQIERLQSEGCDTIFQEKLAGIRPSRTSAREDARHASATGHVDRHDSRSPCALDQRPLRHHPENRDCRRLVPVPARAKGGYNKLHGEVPAYCLCGTFRARTQPHRRAHGGRSRLSQKAQREVRAQVQADSSPAGSGQIHAQGRTVHPRHRTPLQRRRRYNRPHQENNANLMKILPF